MTLEYDDRRVSHVALSHAFRSTVPPPAARCPFRTIDAHSMKGLPSRRARSCARNSPSSPRRTARTGCSARLRSSWSGCLRCSRGSPSRRGTRRSPSRRKGSRLRARSTAGISRWNRSTSTPPARSISRSRPITAPRWKTNGVGLPGYQAGWFRLRRGGKALLFVTDRTRVVFVPTNEGYSVLLSVPDPDVFLRTLRAAAG